MDSNAVFAAATASLLSGKEFEDLRNHFGLTKVDMAVIAVAMQKHGTLGAMYQNEPAMFAVLSLKLRPVLQAMQKHLDLGMKMQMIWFSKADFGSFQKAAEYLMVQNVLRTLQQEAPLPEDIQAHIEQAKTLLSECQYCTEVNQRAVEQGQLRLVHLRNLMMDVRAKESLTYDKAGKKKGGFSGKGVSA